MPALEAPAAPYKYLAFYGVNDAPIFFGRRRETEILLADIISARFVVLFARTGTGKSSLIHAGVIPRLRALDYDAVLTRVGTDPAAALLAKLGLPALPPLADALTAHVDSRDRPLVVFFDQFEEFFGGDVSPETQQSFLTEIGTLYRNAESGVHVVFSLRQDFLAQMAMFRAEIPTIFQAESQLWLRPLTIEQAREGIEGPAAVLGFDYQPGVVDAILAEVPREEGLISTIDMQIVCDTLWRGKRGTVVTMQLYESLGRAAGILRDRVVNDLTDLDAPLLFALEKVIPELSTRDWTKRPRTLADLQRATGIDAKRLEELTEALTRLHLIHVERMANEPTIEWVSDHVSKLSSALTPVLQRAWLRKHRGTVDHERLMTLLSNVALATLLDAEEWYRLLALAATTRDTLGLWFTRTPQILDRYGFLRRLLADSATSEDAAHRVMLFLGEKEEEPAIAILREQLGESRRARIALRALSAIGGDRAVQVIEPALANSELREYALDALRVIDTKRARSLVDKAPSREPAWWERVVKLATGRKSRVHGMAEGEWPKIVGQLRRNPERCGVLLGPDLPSSEPDLAKDLALKWDYPFADRTSLLKVLEYAEVTFGEGWHKAVSPRRLLSPDAASFYAHLVRDLSVGLYVTTSLVRDLEHALMAHGVSPRVGGYLLGGATCGTPDEPTLVHVYGTADDAKEDDKSVSNDDPELMVSLGFDALDELRLMMPLVAVPAHWLIVSPPPELSSDARAAARAYEYRDQSATARRTIYWGTPLEFLDELRDRASVYGPAE